MRYGFIPGRPRRRAAAGPSALEHTRKYPAVTIDPEAYEVHKLALAPEELDGAIGDLGPGTMG